MADSNPETNDERNARLKREHDELAKSLSLPKRDWDPVIQHIEESAVTQFDLAHGRERDDTWSKETAKALDLSDAENAGWMDPERDEDRALEDFVSIAKTHQQRTTELLRTMQAILIEAVSDIEDLQRHFNRLR